MDAESFAGLRRSSQLDCDAASHLATSRRRGLGVRATNTNSAGTSI
jgi:hypothetical protein